MHCVNFGGNMERFKFSNNSTREEQIGFYGLKHVLLANDKHSKVNHKKFIYIPKSKGNLYGTDNVCLHAAPNYYKLKSGFWEVLKNNKNEIWLLKSPIFPKYPPVKKLFNTKQAFRTGLNCTKYKHFIGVDNTEMSRRACIILKTSLYLFDLNRLKNSLEYIGPSADVFFIDQGIVIKDNDQKFKSVLMGMRKDVI